jgi:MYXO-CTERM domain-containing protein
MRRIRLTLSLLVLGVSVPLAGCGAGPTGPDEPGEPVSQTSEPITGSEAVSRAMQWVNAKLLYCQSANHQTDYDTACPSVCNRQDNAAWDPYRSDCSGLVSWAWGLSPPGLVTGEFAPYGTTVSHEINGVDMAPGDAVNNSEHVVLFKSWVTHGSSATFIEEPGCSANPDYAHEFTSNVSINGSAVYISYEGATFYAIRYNSIQSTSDWAAQFVSQSFPYASQGSINMVVGQTLDESITMKNVGAKSWDGKTKLTPTPRDQASTFADSSWLSPTRIVASGSVAPNANHKFSFKLHASKAGTFTQYFGMVEEGVAWFSDPAQGGPPDNQLEAKIVVTVPPYAAQIVSTTFPAAGQALAMTPGQTVQEHVVLKNIGKQSWDSGTRLGTTMPRDRTSPFADSNWLSANRAVAVVGSVAPGSTYDFEIDLKAPSQLGSYTEHFGVVEESVAWFSDTGQGGPPDDALAIPIDVVAPGTTDGGTSPSDGGPLGDGGLPTGDGGPATGSGGASNGAGGGGPGERTRTMSGEDGSCALQTGPATPAGGLALLGWLGLAAVVVRRRRRGG